MKKTFCILFTVLASACFANVHFPEGVNSKTYNVDQFGSKHNKSKKPKRPLTFDQKQMNKTEILPDYRPNR